MAECETRVGRGVTTWQCGLDAGHRGPHSAVEDRRSQVDRQQWLDAQNAAAANLTQAASETANAPEPVLTPQQQATATLREFQGPAMTSQEAWADEQGKGPGTEHPGMTAGQDCNTPNCIHGFGHSGPHQRKKTTGLTQADAGASVGPAPVEVAVNDATVGLPLQPIVVNDGPTVGHAQGLDIDAPVVEKPITGEDMARLKAIIAEQEAFPPIVVTDFDPPAIKPIDWDYLRDRVHVVVLNDRAGGVLGEGAVKRLVDSIVLEVRTQIENHQP